MDKVIHIWSSHCGTVETNPTSWVWPLISLSGSGIQESSAAVSCGCGVGYRCGLDPLLLRLWLAAVAPNWPLAWELPYATGAALKEKKKKKKEGTSAPVRTHTHTHTHTGKTNHKKKQKKPITTNTDRTRDLHTSKTNTMLSLIHGNLKYGTDESIYKIETDSQT